jgi:hypothetical protein
VFPHLIPTGGPGFVDDPPGSPGEVVGVTAEEMQQIESLGPHTPVVSVVPVGHVSFWQVPAHKVEVGVGVGAI